MKPYFSSNKINLRKLKHNFLLILQMRLLMKILKRNLEEQDSSKLTMGKQTTLSMLNMSLRTCPSTVELGNGKKLTRNPRDAYTPSLHVIAGIWVDDHARGKTSTDFRRRGSNSPRDAPNTTNGLRNVAVA